MGSVFKRFVIILLSILLLEIVCLSFIKSDIWPGSNLIGHAFGSVDGKTYTNSLEAFNASYERGIRHFEVDLLLTSDNKVVLVHDWNKFHKSYGRSLTEEEFLSTKILDKYTPLSFEDLLDIMKKYPDIWIITDTKYTKEDEIKKQFNEMLRVVEEKNLEGLLNRFVIQIYHEEMYDMVIDIYPFKNIIFTLYKRWQGDVEDFKAICTWASSKNIKSITMWNKDFTNEIYEISKEYDLDIYVHTENNTAKAKSFLLEGVKGVYTDTISSDALEK